MVQKEKLKWKNFSIKSNWSLKKIKLDRKFLDGVLPQYFFCFLVS